MSASRADTRLIVGPSGSGKTYAAAILCHKIGKKIILVNGRKEEFNATPYVLPAIEESDYSDLPLKESNLTYVLEDIHSIKPKEREAISVLLNYTSRHSKSPCILISHSLHNTGIHSLLNFLTDIYLTREKVNLRVLKTLLRYYSYPRQEEVEKTFLNLKPRQYLHLQNCDQTWNVLDDEMMKREERETDETVNATDVDKEKILSYFSHLGNKESISCILDFLLQNLPSYCITPKDLSVAFKTKKGKVKKISLLDYLFYLNAQNVPPRDIKLFHRFLTKNTCFPRMLCTNANLQKNT